MRPDPLASIKRAAEDDLRAHRAADRRERRRAHWEWWVGLWQGLARNLKIAATIVASATAIAASLATFWHFLGPLWRARDVGSAEEPANGVASTAPDFITKPDAPKRTP